MSGIDIQDGADMQCIFCKEDSTESKSVEHIVPESLGNKSHTLAPGIVCDKCNNYFSHKVEKPVLDSGHFFITRGTQAIPNKRGRIPIVNGIITPGVAAELHRTKDGSTLIHIESLMDAERVFASTKQRGRGTLILPTSGPFPEQRVFSRFLAKIGVEALAQRLCDTEGGIEYLVTETQFDPLRNHARRGYPRDWPFHQRRIYDENKPFLSDESESTQILHEYDFLYTSDCELYFVIAILGIEYTINFGGPEIDGYLKWLEDHSDKSPLYPDS